jgi:hypothetical protein
MSTIAGSASLAFNAFVWTLGNHSTGAVMTGRGPDWAEQWSKNGHGKGDAQ